jgi:hypothetical protein
MSAICIEPDILWQRAGLIRDGAMAIDRPLSLRALRLPRTVELVNGELSYRWQDAQHPFPEERMPDRDVLQRFLRLWDADESEILHYARDWGVLELCEHGFPYTHDQFVVPNPKARCEPVGWEWPKGTPGPDTICTMREPIARWRYFSQVARSILNIAGHLHEGRRGDPADWVIACGSVHTLFAEEADDPEKILSGEWQRLLLKVNDWLELGYVSPRMGLDDDRLYNPGEAPPARTPQVFRPHLRLHGVGLFGALAAQIAFAVVRTDGFAVCWGCGEPYVPKIKPKTGQRCYCRPCREAGAPHRHANRDARRRARQQPGT